VSGKTRKKREEREPMLESAVHPQSGTQEIGEVRTFSARSLLGTGRVIRIEHEGELYTLRLTRNNKLILTK
jgi:hemin uptake protein HemP